MEAAAAASHLLSSSLFLLPRSHLKQFSPPRSALKLSEPAASALSPMLATSLVQYFPTSVLIQEQHCEYRPLLQTTKDDRTSLATVDRGQIETELSTHEEKVAISSDEYLKEFQRQLLYGPGLWNLTKRTMDIEREQVLALARKALAASKEAVLLAEYLDNHITASLGSSSLNELDAQKFNYVKSTRHLERQSTRRESKCNVVLRKARKSRKKATENEARKSSSSMRHPLGRSMANSETKKSLPLKQEKELIFQIKGFMKLEEVKSRLHGQFGREPTLDEWAEAVGLSSSALQSRIHHAETSQRKFIHGQFGLVVHLAKQNEKRGVGLKDLMQAGGLGLLHALRKYEPKDGCRFSSYAYCWIRSYVMRAVHYHSKTIRLPITVYSQLNKVVEAKRACIKEGNHRPTEEQIAAQAGLTVEMVENLLHVAQTPLSMQQTVWSDRATTFEATTADARESPEASVSKQLMRNHFSKLLGSLSPKERKILCLRYGLEGGNQKSLTDIGAIYGVSGGQICQWQTETMNKLKESLERDGLGAYADLLG